MTAARQTCADVGNGEFALEWGAVTRTDLDGDLQPDWVLDDSGYACSTAASFYCSTGGCLSHFLVGDATGACVIVEFLGRETVIHAGEVPEVTGNWIATESTDSRCVGVPAWRPFSDRAPSFRTARLGQ